jgi:hypothetical protein
MAYIKVKFGNNKAGVGWMGREEFFFGMVGETICTRKN